MHRYQYNFNTPMNYQDEWGYASAAIAITTSVATQYEIVVVAPSAGLLMTTAATASMVVTPNSVYARNPAAIQYAGGQQILNSPGKIKFGRGMIQNYWQTGDIVGQLSCYTSLTDYVKNEIEPSDTRAQYLLYLDAIGEQGELARLKEMGRLQPLISQSKNQGSGGGFWQPNDNTKRDDIKISIPGPRNSSYGKIDYLMGRVPNNANSISKGKFFRGVMGFNDESLAKALESQLRDNLSSAQSGSSAYSTVTVNSSITSPTNYTAKVESVWRVVNNNEYMLVSAYPR